MAPDCPHSDFLLLSEAAQYARVSTRTMRRWITQGLPFHQAKTGARLLIRSHDLEQFLTRHETSVTSLDSQIDDVLTSLGTHRSSPQPG